jgi:glycosyltransferase involved in cell wall biosynthesis
MNDSPSGRSGQGPTRNRIDVSVVIPTRNRWKTLKRRALRAALIQQQVRMEVIVVDDGSEMPIPDIPALDDPRVRLIRLPRHAGVGPARNAGIGQARSDWIAFLDDDDMWAPTKLASTVGAAENAGADFAYSDVLVLTADFKPAEVAKGGRPDELAKTLRKANTIPAAASNLVVSAPLLAKLGGFDESFTALTTWDLCLRLAHAGRAEYVDNVLIAYPEGRWLITDLQANRADAERMAIKHEDMAVDWYGFERWVADTNARSGRRREAAMRYISAGLRHRNPRCIALAGAAILGPRAVARLRRAPRVEGPEWLSIYTERSDIRRPTGAPS